MDESWRRGLLGSRLDPGSIRRSMMKAPGSGSAIQTVLAGVMCHLVRYRLIIRQFS